MLSKRHFPLLFLLLAVCLVYSNSFSNSFHFDDFHTVTDNPAVRSLGNLHRIFTDTTAFSVLPANQTYRPIVTASLALDYALAHGYNPFWFHLSTFLWFLLLIAVIFSLSEHLLDRIQPSDSNLWLALAIAAWFGLHPAMAETVNYVIQRGDLYCTLGCMASLLLFAKRPARRQYGFYLLPFVLALLSKPPASIFPLLLLLYVFFFETGNVSTKQRWLKSLLTAIPAIVTTAALLFLQHRMTPKTYLPAIISPADYRMTQPFVWLRYCGELFLPLHLNVDTDLQPFTTVTLQALAGWLFALILLATIAYTARRRTLYPIAYGLLWFLITQLPTSLYTLSEVENDHRMFFSFPGLMLAVVWTLYLLGRSLRSELTRRGLTPQPWIRPALIAGAALCLCGYAYGAHRRNEVWRSEPTLWADDVAKCPHNGRGLMIYGLTRMNAGDFTGALNLFNRALVYTPNYATLEINLGVVNGLLAAGGNAAQNATAEAHFQRAIALAPGDDTTHAYYGRWLLTQGRLPEATTELSAAVSLNPQRQMQRDLLLTAYGEAGNLLSAKALARDTLHLFPEDAQAVALVDGTSQSSAATSPAAPFVNASLAAYNAGQFQQSIAAAQGALKADPHSAEAWNNIGAAYGAMHQWMPAIAAEQQALKLAPALQIAQNNLRWFTSQSHTASTATNAEQIVPSARLAEEINLSLTLNQQARYTESLAAAREAVAIDPNSAEAWNNIAANEEAMQHWDEAITAARKAVALQPDFRLAKNNLAWSQAQKAAASPR